MLKTNYTVTLKDTLYLQKSPSDNEMAYTLNKGDKAFIVISNDKEWFCLSDNRNKYGWFKISNRSINDKKISDVFENLYISD